MSATCQEVEVKDIGDLEKLVAKNIEGIESGLQVIDSRVLLGHAAIDLIGLDAKGASVANYLRDARKPIRSCFPVRARSRSGVEDNIARPRGPDPRDQASSERRKSRIRARCL